MRVSASRAQVEHTVSGEVRIGGQEHFYLETNNCVIIPGEDREFTLFASTQVSWIPNSKFCVLCTRF